MLRTLGTLELRGKRVLVREDLNVPMRPSTGSGQVEIGDYQRIDAALPTLRYLADHGAKVIVVAHLGRPGGKPNPKYTLQPVAAALTERLGMGVTFATDVAGESAHHAAESIAPGELVLLENVRFEPGEERNDPEFAKKLASLADAYVNDAFGAAHRAHASTEGVAHYLPSVAGLLMEKEVRELSKLLDHPPQPYVCVIGGAKVEDKISVLEKLSERVGTFCTGGGMANTFLAAAGRNVGGSLRDDDLGPAKSIARTIEGRGAKLLVPVDAVLADSFDADSTAHALDVAEITRGMILDIGPQTAKTYAHEIENAKTVIFNGPMGVYEKPVYQNGTRAVCEAMAAATLRGATTIVGGGDASAAAFELGFADKVTHVSTGGGATLEFLEGKTLPGIAALVS